ncbi:hypothetical protein NAK90_005037 [Salmonella enterica]|nr:hypothetical protein [Salmonella enterica subsp. enterica serovar Oranienburg]EJG7681462.1 hypothetical protein [Salmonella enterica]
MMTDNKNALMHECYQFVTIDAEKGKIRFAGTLTDPPGWLTASKGVSPHPDTGSEHE